MNIEEYLIKFIQNDGQVWRLSDEVLSLPKEEVLKVLDMDYVNSLIQQFSSSKYLRDIEEDLQLLTEEIAKKYPNEVIVRFEEYLQRMEASEFNFYENNTIVRYIFVTKDSIEKSKAQELLRKILDNYNSNESIVDIANDMLYDLDES